MDVYNTIKAFFNYSESTGARDTGSLTTHWNNLASLCDLEAHFILQVIFNCNHSVNFITQRLNKININEKKTKNKQTESKTMVVCNRKQCENQFEGKFDDWVNTFEIEIY